MNSLIKKIKKIKNNKESIYMYKNSNRIVKKKKNSLNSKKKENKE